MAKLKEISDQVLTVLNALKDEGTLGTVERDSFAKDPWKRDIASFPAAFLSSPVLESEEHSNGENLRAYTFDVFIMVKGENLTSATEIEDLMEKILNGFDAKYTLDGKAEGGVTPAISPALPFVTTDQSFVMFNVSITAKTLVNIQ